MSLRSIKLVTSTQDLDPVYDTFFIDASQGSIIFTLPNIALDGLNYYIKRIDSSLLTTVTIKGYNASQTINGSTSVLLLGSNAIFPISFNGEWN